MTWFQFLFLLGLSNITLCSVVVDDDGVCYTEVQCPTPVSTTTTTTVTPSLPDAEVTGHMVCEEANCGASVKAFDPFEELLENLPDTWSFGMAPVIGNFHVYGDGDMVNGVSVTVIKNSGGGTSVAAAQLKQGRIIATSHTDFATQFLGTNTDPSLAQLQANIRNWLTKGLYTSPSEVCTIKTAEDANDCLARSDVSIMFMVQPAFNSSGIDDKMLAYVEEGGSIYLAVTPWAYFYYYGRDFNLLPFAKVYHEAGFLLGKMSSGHPLTTISTDDEKEVYRRENIGYLVDISTTPKLVEENVDDLKTNVNLLGLSNNVVPPYVKHVIVDKYIDLYLANVMNMKVPRGGLVSNSGYNGFLISLTDNLARHGSADITQVPGIEVFPGHVDRRLKRNPPIILTDKTVSARADRIDFHVTGLYHIAGSELRITVLSVADDFDQWKIRIGSCTDNLKNNDEVKRWPKIFTRENILSREYIIANDPTGGLIYLESPSTPSYITVGFHQVLKAPGYEAGMVESGWNLVKHNPAPWVDVSGRYVTFSVPRKAIKGVSFDDVKSMMEIWDKSWVNNFDLRTDDVNKHRRQFFTTDTQLTRGYMHAGYPIMTHLDVATPDSKVFFLNEDLKPKWGHWHEMGHNMQRNWWTFPSIASEVTCNLFTLYNMHNLAGIDPWYHPWLNDRHDEAAEIVVAVPREQRNAVWDSMGANDKLFLYAQMQHHFGWNCYKKVFEWYENPQNKGNRPSTNQERRDAWVTQWSLVTNYNLLPMYEFWGWNVSATVHDRLSGLTPVLPVDETVISSGGLTTAGDESNRIASRYPGTIRSVRGQTFCNDVANGDSPT